MLVLFVRFYLGLASTQGCDRSDNEAGLGPARRGRSEQFTVIVCALFPSVLASWECLGSPSASLNVWNRAEVSGTV